MIYITLNQIKAHKPCDGWEKLLKSLNKTKADNTEVEFSYIAKNNSVSDSLWCLRCIDVEKHKKEISLLCADIADSVLHIYEKEHSNDSRVRESIEAVRDFVEGKITREDLESKRHAARADAARGAAADARAAAADAADAARAADAAARAAARADAADADAAADAARAAAADARAAAAATYATERQKQIDLIKKHLG